MKQQDFSLFNLILKGVAGLFGLIAFVTIFFDQAKMMSFWFTSGEILGGTNNYNGTPLPLIGYILICLATLGSIALIFTRKFIPDVKTVKLIDLALGCAFVVGGVLVVLTTCWMAAANPKLKDLLDYLTLGSAPIVACVFASLAGIADLAVGLFIEERA